MIDSTKFFLFLTAAILLAVAPGPGMLYVLARSLAGGKREGVLSAFGTFLGGMVHVFAAALGVSVILAKSAVAFATVKYVGAAYLCFLGVHDTRCTRGKAGSGFPCGRFAHSRVRIGTVPASSKPALAGGCHGTAESQDGFVFSFIHSTICEPDRRVRVSGIRLFGHVVSFSEHLRRLDRDCAGRAARSSHSFLREFPATAKNGHRGDHDRTGNLSGDQREQVRSRTKTRLASQGRAGPVSQLQNLMIVAIELDGVVELVQ